MRRLATLTVASLAGVALIAQTAPAGSRSPTKSKVAAANCSRTSVGFTPLTDLRPRRYHGFQGGLYPRGRNRPPRAYLNAGLAAAKRVRPRTSDGAVSPAGRIVVLSIGMSNVVIEFSAFQQLAHSDHGLNRHLTIVNGAEGGVDGDRLLANSSRYFAWVDRQLAAAAVTERQVQAVWLKEAIAGEREPFPADAQHLRRDLDAIIALLKGRFPNLRLVYLSSRIYAGYATSSRNPEPYAYDSGFAVKWTVSGHLTHPRARPWVAWGPYLWADGTRARRDRLTWSCADFAQDGTHPSAQGADKVGRRLLGFFTTNRTTRGWFDRARR